MYVANRDSEPLQIVYDRRDGGEGMKFVIQVKVKVEGGAITKSDSSLLVSNADAVTLYLAEETSFNGYNKSPGLAGKDPIAMASVNLQAAVQKSYTQLKASHVADYQQLFHRVKLDLGKDPRNPKVSYRSADAQIKSRRERQSVTSFVLSVRPLSFNCLLASWLTTRELTRHVE